MRLLQTLASVIVLGLVGFLTFFVIPICVFAWFLYGEWARLWGWDT